MSRVLLLDGERSYVPDKPAFHQWDVHVQGQCVQVRKRLMYAKSPNTVKRGDITELSKASRYRLMRTANRIDWENNRNHLFVTLTWPDWCMVKMSKGRTRQRAEFQRKMEKHLGREIPGLWRIEWKRRLSGDYKGYPVPHIHLLLYGLAFYDQFCLREHWRRTIRAGEFLCTDVRKVYGHVGALAYVCKYMSKADALDKGAYLRKMWTHGRTWGVLRPSRVPWAKVRVERKLSAGELDFVFDQACLTNPRYNPALDGGFTILGEDAADEFAGVLGEFA